MPLNSRFKSILLKKFAVGQKIVEFFVIPVWGKKMATLWWWIRAPREAAKTLVVANYLIYPSSWEYEPRHEKSIYYKFGW